MKTIKHTIIFAFFTLLLLTGCGENKIDFEVKADYTIDVNVATTSSNGSIVSTFEVESEIDLTDKIDNIEDISSLLVTGVELELKNYLPLNRIFGSAGYYDDFLTGDLTVTLLSNNNDNVIFSGNVNFGTNVGSVANLLDSDYTKAQPVILQITETEAKDLIENKKVKLKIKMTNGVIRDDAFNFNMVVQTKAVTAI